ncbi:hypothetical protein GZH46_02956, partial [Fragariocoptes setiger]
MSKIVALICLSLVVCILAIGVDAHKKFYGGGQPGCRCDCQEPGFHGSGGYAPSHGPPIPTGGHYGNAGYHQPRPSGYGNAGSYAVAGSYGSGGNSASGGY